jgi:hypothetical protein
VLGYRVKQRRGLQLVAASPAAGFLGHPARVDRFLHGRDDEAGTGFGSPPVTELQYLGEVVPGVHVHQRKGDARRAERPLREGKHHDRVLTAREQQHRPLELGGDFPQDLDRLGLEDIEVGQQVVRARRWHQGAFGSVGTGCAGSQWPT